MPCDIARRLLGPKAVIGLSVETWEDVEAAELMDVDYLGVSPVFATPTKTDTKAPWGLEGLTRIRAYSSHPLVAIGGISGTMRPMSSWPALTAPLSSRPSAPLPTPGWLLQISRRKYHGH
jgi:thiamine-phosphate pyrophosphorylase